MGNQNHPATRLEADAEGPAVVISIYAPVFFATVELPALDARRLAAELTQAADYAEAQGHDH